MLHLDDHAQECVGRRTNGCGQLGPQQRFDWSRVADLGLQPASMGKRSDMSERFKKGEKQEHNFLWVVEYSRENSVPGLRGETKTTTTTNMLSFLL